MRWIRWISKQQTCHGVAFGFALLMLAPTAEAGSLGSDALKGMTPTVTPSIQVSPTPQVQDRKIGPAVIDPPETKVCPKPGVLDCMPKVGAPASPYCRDLDWIRRACPGVQVVF